MLWVFKRIKANKPRKVRNTTTFPKVEARYIFSFFAPTALIARGTITSPTAKIPKWVCIWTNAAGEIALCCKVNKKRIRKPVMTAIEKKNYSQ